MKVYELLNNESRWTKEVYARDEDNEPIYHASVDACKWCVSGAIKMCYDKKRGKCKK